MSSKKSIEQHKNDSIFSYRLLNKRKINAICIHFSLVKERINPYIVMNVEMVDRMEGNRNIFKLKNDDYF